MVPRSISPRRLLAATLCLLSAAAAIGGCRRPATQLLVVVDTDAADGTYTCARIEVLRVEGERVEAGGAAGLLVPAQVTLPFSIGVAPPDGDARRRVQVVAELRDDACGERVGAERPPRIRRVVRTGFLPEQTLRLPIFLADRCRDVPCAQNETCASTSGTCEPIPEVSPESLVPVTPGAELADAGSAPTPDAGVVCVAGLEVAETFNGAVGSFALARAAENERTIRAAWMGGETVQAYHIDWVNTGGSVGGAGIGGPVGAALLSDGAHGAYVYQHAVRGATVRVFPYGAGTSDEVSIGGTCPSTRCAAGFGGFGGEFAVLTGPAPLILHEVTTAAIDTGGTAVVGGPVTFAAVREASVGVLISHAAGGSCTLEHWRTISGPSETLEVPMCDHLDVAELPDGSFALAWSAVSLGGRVAVGTADATLVSFTEIGLLGSLPRRTGPLEVRATTGGFRVTFVVESSSPMLWSARFDSGGGRLEDACVAVAGHTSAEYQMFHAITRGATTVIEWPHADRFFAATLPD